MRSFSPTRISGLRNGGRFSGDFTSTAVVWTIQQKDYRYIKTVLLHHFHSFTCHCVSATKFHSLFANSAAAFDHNYCWYKICCAIPSYEQLCNQTPITSFLKCKLSSNFSLDQQWGKKTMWPHKLLGILLNSLRIEKFQQLHKMA